MRFQSYKLNLVCQTFFLLAQSLSRVQFFVTPRTIACQAPLPMESSWQEYWSGVPFPTPWDLPDPGIKPTSLASPALAGEYFTSSANWEAFFILKKC